MRITEREIALPVVRQNVIDLLHKRVEEAINQVSNKYIYEPICQEMMMRVMYDMTQVMGKLVTELQLPEQIECYQEDADSGGKVFLFVYNKCVIGKAYITP